VAEIQILQFPFVHDFKRIRLPLPPIRRE